MGFSRGPSIVRDGLVLSLDAGNNKSFRGEPTTNLLGAAGSDAEIERSGNSYPYYSVNINSVVQSNWSEGNNVITISFEGKRDYVDGGTGGGGDGYPVFYVYFTDWTWAATVSITSYNWTYNKRTFTMPNPSGKTVFFSIYHMNAGNRGISYSRKHQIEFKPYATPFVNGTRGTTVDTGGGWLDRSGNNNHGELVNGANFNSDNFGSLSFDGINDNISIPNPIISNLPYTILQWVKPNVALPDTTNSGSRKTPLVGPGPVWNPGYWLTARVFRVHAHTEYRDVTINWVNDTSWHQIGQIFDGTTCYTVIDGSVLLGTRTAYNPPITSSILIGSETTGGGSPNWNGNISNISFYNRALTSSEVLQNFNATKNRYLL